MCANKKNGMKLFTSQRSGKFWGKLVLWMQNEGAICAENEFHLNGPHITHLNGVQKMIIIMMMTLVVRTRLRTPTWMKHFFFEYSDTHFTFFLVFASLQPLRLTLSFSLYFFSPLKSSNSMYRFTEFLKYIIDQNIYSHADHFPSKAYDMLEYYYVGSGTRFTLSKCSLFNPVAGTYDDYCFFNMSSRHTPHCY